MRAVLGTQPRSHYTLFTYWKLAGKTSELLFNCRLTKSAYIPGVVVGNGTGVVGKAGGGWARYKTPRQFASADRLGQGRETSHNDAKVRGVGSWASAACLQQYIHV